MASCAVLTAALCALGPALIRRLPEPRLSSDAGDKVAYAELGRRPGLGWRLAITGAVAGGVVGWRLGAQPVLAVWVYLAAVGVVLAYVDAQTRLLPTRVIAPSYAVVAGLLVVAAWLDGDWGLLAGAGLGWLAMGGFYLLMWLVYPAGLGYGDVRLSGLLGLALGYLGWAEVLVGMYAGFLVGGVVGALLAAVKIVDRKRYPFGPFMLIGAVAGVVWGTAFAEWYSSW